MFIVSYLGTRSQLSSPELAINVAVSKWKSEPVDLFSPKISQKNNSTSKNETKIKRWGPESMEKALKAVLYHDSTIRGAAESYDVPKSTLGDRICGKVLPGIVLVVHSKYLMTRKKRSWFNLSAILPSLVKEGCCDTELLKTSQKARVTWLPQNYQWMVGLFLQAAPWSHSQSTSIIPSRGKSNWWWSYE